MMLVTTVLADPPWPWNDRLRMSAVKRGSEDQYGAMTIDEIRELYQPSSVVVPERQAFADPQRRVRAITYPSKLAGYLLADVGFLLLWTTATHLLNGNAVQVCRHWGYEPKQIVPWVKGEGIAAPRPDVKLDTLGMGWTFRSVAEFLIVATRGKYLTLVKTHTEPGLILDDLILARRPPRRKGSKHSIKPPSVYEKIERVCPGPYLELFARERRAGWISHGNQLPEIALPDPGLEGQWAF